MDESPQRVGRERRSDTRERTVEREVRCRVELPDGTTLEGIVENISQGGARIAGPATDLGTGDEIRIAFVFLTGEEVAYRKQGKLWWLNDYRYEWDVDLTGKLKPGKNVIALRCNCEHHLGGMFRRPFLYQRIAP